MKQDEITNRSAVPFSTGWHTWMRRVFGPWKGSQEQPATRHARIPRELKPDTPLMDACRTLRVSLTPGQIATPIPSLLLTGTAVDRRCVLTAVGLALVMAEEGRTTLVVDADLRHPILHKLLDISLSPGFATALSDSNTPVVPIMVSQNCWALPAGVAQHNATALLRRPTVGDVVQTLGERFDVVIFSLPGGLVHPDMLLLAPHIGTAVLTVRSGIDSADDARSLKQSLERAGVQIAGFAFLE